MIQLYHAMGTLVTRLWRALVAPPTPVVPPGGPPVLPAYAALARYQTSSPDLDPRLRLLVTQLAAERSRCRWCIDRGRHLWREAQLPIELVAAQHFFNPITGARGADVTPWGAPVGSSMRNLWL